MNERIEFDGGLNPGRQQAGRLQAAVDAVHESGGGRVTVGPGTWVATTVTLRSNIELHLERGAVLQAHHDLNDYPRAERAARNVDQSPFHLLLARGCDNVTLSGDGVIDGQDTAFWTPCEGEEDRPYGIFRFKVKGGAEGRPSPLVQLVGCTNLRIVDIGIRRAPGWALHLFDCETVSVHGVRIRGNRCGPNTDGIGINGSRGVRISHCDVDTGDDAIIVKATNEDSVCERVTVANCVLSSNCAALGLGADVAGVVRDVVFSGCVVNRSLRMIQVEMWFPGQVERALFSGITGRTFPDEGVANERPIYVDIQQFKRPEAELGKVSGLIFRDIICESRGRIVMTAQDGATIRDVTLDTVIVRVPEIEDPQESVPRARSMQLSNFNPQTRAVRAAVVADNVVRLTLRNVEYHWPEKAAVPMHALCLRNSPDLINDSPRLRSSGGDTPAVLEL